MAVGRGRKVKGSSYRSVGELLIMVGVIAFVAAVVVFVANLLQREGAREHPTPTASATR